MTAPRRIAAVTALYVAAALLLVMPFVAWLARLLLLPPLFTTIAWSGVALGLPLAGLVAWRYPEIGRSENGSEQ